MPLDGDGSSQDPSLVGPNALIQLAEALRAREGADAAQAIFDAAGEGAVLRRPPSEMIEAARAARLFGTTLRVFGPARGGAVLAEAGRLTADYVIANRIPKLARRLLRIAPPGLAEGALLAAIRRHAWTFAGSTEVSVGTRPTLWIEIAANPMATAGPTEGQGCPWHRAVFERLFAAMIGGAHTGRAASAWRHPCCCAEGAPVCRFERATAHR